MSRCLDIINRYHLFNELENMFKFPHFLQEILMEHLEICNINEIAS